MGPASTVQEKQTPSPRTRPRSATLDQATIRGFRLGIYVFKDAEIVDFAAPYGVFSVARRFDPALDVFLVAETLRPVQAQAGFTVEGLVVVSRTLLTASIVDFYNRTRSIPRSAGAHRLHDYVRSLPDATLLTSVCTGSWIYAQIGLLDGIAATSRKEPDRQEAAGHGADRPPGRPGPGL